MKKTVLLTVLVLACLLILFWPVFAQRGGGEVTFEAVIDRVEGSDVYATVTKTHTGLSSRKLPENIVFDTGYLDTALRSGDKIRGSYRLGTLAGNRVQVVAASVVGTE